MKERDREREREKKQSVGDNSILRHLNAVRSKNVAAKRCTVVHTQNMFRLSFRRRPYIPFPGTQSQEISWSYIRVCKYVTRLLEIVYPEMVYTDDV